MILGILTFLSALTISAVAIYYSVAGLAAIFAAAVIPIIIMGVSLEVGKLVTAVWLHRHWKQATWWLKTYLSVAVIVLMFITSMGIFGYLSKAHIEQTSAGEESIAQVERIESEIKRNEEIIVRAENQIKKLETTGTGNDANIQAQIDKEQERIDNAYKRIQPAIDEQQKIIDSQSVLWKNELVKIDKQIETLQTYIDNGETAKAQQMIGASADGIFGKKTADKIGDWQEKKQKERLELIAKIEQATNNPQAKAAAEEIKRLRKTAEDQIKQSNALIDRLRKQLGNEDKLADVDEQVDEQYNKIKKANASIDTLVEQKYSLEGEYRKLEAEVGPIKYIAEFIYGEEADRDLLEEAVRWVIILIIFVFDPLAVLLLIASQYTFQFARPGKKDTAWEDYEKARAKKIVENSAPEPTPEEDKTYENEIEKGVVEETPDIDQLIDEEIKNIDDEIKEETKEIAKEYQQKEVHKPKVRLTEEQIDELDKHPLWTEAKRKWKDMNPNKTIKSFKEKYLLGEIDEFPWEKYLDEEEQSFSEKMQAELEPLPETATVEEALKLPENESVQTPINDISSDSDQTTVDSGYIQNEEQTEDTNWRNIRDKNE